MADALAARLQEHGLIKREFFLQLLKLRPLQAEEIQETAAAWGLPLEPLPKTNLVLRGGRVTMSRLAAYIASMACAAAAAIWFGMGTEPLPELHPNALDQVPLTVVSAKTGESWTVLVSLHQMAEEAAREIFLAFHLQGNAEIGKLFQSGQYELCQDDGCRCRESVGNLDILKPVTVRFEGAKFIFICGRSEGNTQHGCHNRPTRSLWPGLGAFRPQKLCEGFL